ncbi:MAG: hypothetical protein AAGD14_04835 [Planctomycetota bacterium]
MESAARKPIARPLRLAAASFDAVFSERNVEWMGRWLIRLALIGFLVHLLLILLNQVWPDPPRLLSLVGTSYLAALYTPFSLILFYEVIQLVLSVPESTTRSNGKEYEIVSLIVLRSAFKDLALLDSAAGVTEQTEAVKFVLLDMFGGLAMFLLVACFYHVARIAPVPTLGDHAEDRSRLAQFVALKKAIALGLATLLAGFALWSFGSWAVDAFRVAYLDSVTSIDLDTLFYAEFFTIMIFSDVVILIVSMTLSDRYELVFRNAGFVASTVLIRLSLIADRPYRLLLGLLAIGFGVLVLLIYQYCRRVRSGEASPAAPPSGRSS